MRWRSSSRRRRLARRVGPALLALVSLACTHSAIDPNIVELEPPARWHRGDTGDIGNVAAADWLASLGDPRLPDFVAEALANNHQLAQERTLLEQSEQAMIVVSADRKPTLDLRLTALEQGEESASGGSTSEGRSDLLIDVSWEVDVWGRLSARQQAAQLEYAAQQSRLLARQREIAATTAAAFFNVLEAKRLLTVAEQRLENARSSQEIVEGGYRQGLQEALDLYLANSQLARDRAALADQEERLVDAVIALQLALGRYPDGDLALNGRLPVIEDAVSAGAPSQVLTRRADLRESWLRLLAADAAVAVAHKNRFPRVTLAGTGGITSGDLSGLVDGARLTGSLLGSLTHPFFQAGRLAALERQAVAQVRQAEQLYLEAVFLAFSQVEGALHRETTLHRRYATYLEAEQNAVSALTLALEQYQRGLVDYTTVLESQRQAFDAATTVIQLRNALLQNRIALHLALGGGLALDETKE